MKDLIAVALIAGGATTLGYVKDVWVRWRTEVVALEDRKREIAKEEAAARSLEEAEAAKKKAHEFEEIASEMTALPDFLIEQIEKLNDEKNVLAVEKFIAEYQLHQQEEAERQRRHEDRRHEDRRPNERQSSAYRPSWERLSDKNSLDVPQEEP